MSINVSSGVSSSVYDVLEENAVRLSRAMAQGLKPPPRLSVSQWAEAYRVFGDETSHRGPYRASTAPYLTEPLEKLSVYDPAEVVTVMKCAQSGGSVMAENWIGYIADLAPGPAMYVQATVGAAGDWSREKLQPMVNATPRLNSAAGGLILGASTKEAKGSTKLRLEFRRGGWLLLCGANSAASLRQHSIRYAIEDDLDQFPDDLDNQGSPETMVGARLRVYARQKMSKRLKISTPTIKGVSKIAAAYEISDQRRFYLTCPGCGARFDPTFQDIHWERDNPESAVLSAPCCGQVIEHWQKQKLLEGGRWLATCEIDGNRPPRHMPADEFETWAGRHLAGRQPGYHVTGVISAFMTWAQLAKGFLEAQGDVTRLKGWTNLDLGEPFELRGDAPAAESLGNLRETSWRKGQTPWGPAVATMGCDVQGDGIYFELVGWGEGLCSWTLDHGFLPGPTDVPGEGAWERLEQMARRQILWPGGRETPIDQICIDGGFNTAGARAFAARNPRRMVVFGKAGWTLPLLGRGDATSYVTRGKRAGRASVKAEDKAFLVGTFGAKLAWFGYLRASLKAAAEEAAGRPVEFVRGRVRFGEDCGEDYFDQLTSEACVTELKGYATRRVWRVLPGRQNHWLDCRVYNLAAAEALSLASLNPSDWVRLQQERCAAAPDGQLDLVQLANRVAQPPPGDLPPPPPPRFNPSTDGGWVNIDRDWI
jgi:phage terminase large subunit GpA-like protein